MKLLLVLLLSVASTFAFARSGADDVVIECVEVVKTGPTCKALTYGCMGGYKMTVNGHQAKTYVKSSYAESNCLSDKETALTVLELSKLEQNDNPYGFQCRRTINCMPSIGPVGSIGNNYCGSVYQEWEDENCPTKALIAY